MKSQLSNETAGFSKGSQTVPSSRSKAAQVSPWTIGFRVKMLAWEISWSLFCKWTPKPLNRWRIIWLKLFGAQIIGDPFVHQKARIQIPWHLTLHDRCCLGDCANLYSLARIEVGENAVIAQEAYICTGTHDFEDPSLPLRTSRISIGKNAFIGARAFILPGVCIGEGAIVGACSIVTSNVEPFSINAGNPCRKIKSRNRSSEQ